MTTTIFGKTIASRYAAIVDGCTPYLVTYRANLAFLDVDEQNARLLFDPVDELIGSAIELYLCDDARRFCN